MKNDARMLLGNSQSFLLSMIGGVILTHDHQHDANVQLLKKSVFDKFLVFLGWRLPIIQGSGRELDENDVQRLASDIVGEYFAFERYRA